jgi:hypothetical protein
LGENIGVKLHNIDFCNIIPNACNLISSKVKLFALKDAINGVKDNPRNGSKFIQIINLVRE